MRGSSPFLLLAVVAFLLLFCWQRGGSTVLAVERQAPELRALAAKLSLPPAAVLALRAEALDLDAAAFAARAARFAALRHGLGDPFAALAVLADEATARSLLQRHGGDPARAWPECRAEPAALPGLQFEVFAARFALRAAGRGP